MTGIELQILDMIQTWRTPILDSFMSAITRLGDGGVFWIALAVVLLVIPKTRKYGIVMAVALILDLLICNICLKNLVARTRPYDVNTAIELIARKPRDYSFPSGHTAAAFTATFALYFARCKKWWILSLVLAVLIAISRLYLYMHFPTDVLGGIFIGVLCGYLANKIIKSE